MGDQDQDFVFDLVEGLSAENAGKVPGVKQVAAAFGCTQKEAKDILQQYKEHARPPQKKQKTKPPAEKEVAEEVAEDAVVDDDGKKDEAEPPMDGDEEPEYEAEAEVEDTLVDPPPGGFDGLEDEPPEDEPDRQPDGPSPIKTDQPGSRIDRANTQRHVSHLRTLFDRSVATLLRGQQLLRGQSSSELGATSGPQMQSASTRQGFASHVCSRGFHDACPLCCCRHSCTMSCDHIMCVSVSFVIPLGTCQSCSCHAMHVHGLWAHVSAAF